MSFEAGASAFVTGSRSVPASVLDVACGRRLFDDLAALWTEHNTAGPDATRVESEFMEVVGIRA